MECKEFGSIILCQISYNHIDDLSKRKADVFLQQKCHYIDEGRKGIEGRLGTIIYNRLCSELDSWYKYVKENQGDKYTC
jgi:hypothetical protein